MISLKITESDKKLPSRFWMVVAILAMALTGLSCSEEETAEVSQETAPVVAKEVCLYQEKNYGGWEKCYTEDQPKFKQLGINDQVSSLKVKGGAEAELFQHHDYQGFNLIYQKDTPELGSREDNQFSSLKIK